MILSEVIGLINAIREIIRYAKKHEDAISFYRHLDELNCPSLSTISFSSDLKFFEECQFILNVVISIIAHPHLSNKGEDIVLRAEQVSQLSSDMYIKTKKAPQLW